MATVEDLPIEELRARRMQARRAAELARLRARQGGEPQAQAVDRLDAEVRLLTEALISRYAEDLALVDSLLDPAYPAGGTPVGRAAP